LQFGGSRAQSAVESSQDLSMTDVEQRVAAVEARLENAFALDARLKGVEGDLRKLKSSSLRDWLQTLGPYIGGLVVLLVGFWIKDSVTIALQREQLDLNYVQQMRDLIKDFAQSQDETVATANAIGLAMYGEYAVFPLVERLEDGGDVIPAAAERGLRLIGTEHAPQACLKFRRVINDRTHRFRWQTHKTLIKVIGQSECTDGRADLENYRAALKQLATAESRTAFSRRYSVQAGFDGDSVKQLVRELDAALEILSSQVKT
jgi:hypothetical protein